MRRLATLAALALVAAPAAAASGPSPGVLQGGAGVAAGGVAYNTVYGEGRTSLTVWHGSRVARTVMLRGDWGVPLVSWGQQAGGLSHDGHTLVLAQGGFPTTPLRRVSRFLVLDTRHLDAAPHRVRLRGDFSFDALSPHGRMLYLIEHTSSRDLTHYRVRAYDLGAGQLLPRVIADKRQRSWVMSGQPMLRATSPDGRWEYTFYSQPGNYPFVHALDTVGRTAVCIGIPWDWRRDESPVELSVRGGKLVVRLGLDRKRYVIDVHTLRLELHA